jgi:hypothetical protein
VEWFACPEGPITVEASERPEPLITTFLLNSGNENQEVFGAALHFFIGLDIGLSNAHDAYSKYLAHKQGTRVWWEDPIGKNSKEYITAGNGKSQLWTAATVAFLFRIEFFDEISRCLLNYYYSTIQQSIVDWEKERADYVQTMQRRFQETSGAIPYFDLHKMELLSAIPPCNTLIEHFVALLRCGCPTPITDLLSISIDFPANVDGIPESVLFEAKSSDELPASPDALGFILQNFGPKIMLEIFCCVLSECRILFHSRNLSNLRKICGGFRNLTYPLFWAHVYLPVVPIHLLNLVEAPVPFLLGVHSDSLVYMNLQYVTDIVIVDCDSGAITANSAVVMSLPEKDDRWLTEALSNLLIPEDIWNDHIPPDESQLALQFASVDVQLEYMSLDQKVQLIFFDFLLHLLRFVPDCLFYLNPNFPLFNRQLFLSEYTDEDYRSMLSSLTVTNAFHSFTETLQTPAMQYFYRIVDQIAAAETQVINDTRNKSNNNASVEAMDCASPKSELGSAKNMKTSSPVKSYLSRQVSVRSIVLDKISLATTPNPRNIATGGPSSVGGPSDNGPLSARGVQRGTSLSRASIFATASSHMADNTGNFNASGSMHSIMSLETPTNKQSMMRLKSVGYMESNRATPGLSTPKVSSMPYFTFDVVTLRYAELYPVWLFQDQGPLKKDHFFHVQDIVRSRFRYHESIRKQIIEKRRRHWKKYMVHVSVEEVVREVYAKEEAQQGQQQSHRREEICSVIDDILLRVMDENKQLQHAENNTALSLRAPLADSEHPLVQFDPQLLQESELYAMPWTISHLATVLQVEVDEMRRQIEERLDDQTTQLATPTSQLTSMTNNTTPLKPGHLNGHQFRRNSIAANKLQKPTQQMMEKISLRNQSLDPALADFFQKTILSENIDERYVQDALPKCEHELHDLKNRDTLVLTLRHAKRERGKHETAAPIYLLSDASFDAFAALFTCMLRICSDTEDYLNANGLLEVGSYYCRKLPDEVIQNMIEMNESEHDFFEFLSEKIFQHPIYQNPNFWKKLLTQRISGSSRYSPKDENAPKFPFMLIMTEVKSLLLNMHGMKVNFARALAFIQGVAADFKLTIDEYYHMQRYAMGLWESQSPVLDASAPAAAVAGGLGIGEDMSGHGMIMAAGNNNTNSNIASVTRDDSHNSKWVKRTASLSLVRSRDNILVREGGGISSAAHLDKFKAFNMTKLDDSFYYQDNGSGASGGGMLPKEANRSFAQQALLQTSSFGSRSNSNSFRRASMPGGPFIGTTTTTSGLTASASGTNQNSITNSVQNTSNNVNLDTSREMVGRVRSRTLSNSHILPNLASSTPSMELTGAHTSPAKSTGDIDEYSTSHRQFQNHHHHHHRPSLEPVRSSSVDAEPRTKLSLLLAEDMRIAQSRDENDEEENDDEEDFFPTDHSANGGVLPLISASPHRAPVSPGMVPSSKIGTPIQGSQHHSQYSFDQPNAHSSLSTNVRFSPTSLALHIPAADDPDQNSSTSASAPSTPSQSFPFPKHQQRSSSLSSPRHNQQSLLQAQQQPPPPSSTLTSTNSQARLVAKKPTSLDRQSSWTPPSNPTSSSSNLSTAKAYNNSTSDSNSILTKMKPIDIKGLEATNVFAQSLACVSNWLVVGDDDGFVHIADLHSASVVAKWKHGSGSSNDENYRGITAIHAIPAPCTPQHDYVVFSGCSDGLVKIWTLPNQSYSHSPLHHHPSSGSAGHAHRGQHPSDAYGPTNRRPNANVKRTIGDWIGTSQPTVTSSLPEEKIRLKPSTQSIKLHSHRITSFAGDLYAQHSSSNMGWIVAAGDASGGCSVSRNVHENELVSQKMRITAPMTSAVGTAASKIHHSDSGHPKDMQDGISAISFFSCGTQMGAGASNMVMNVVKQHYGSGGSGANASSGGNIGSSSSGTGSGRHAMDPLLAVGSVTGVVAVVDINVGHSIFAVDGHASQVAKLVPVKPNVFLSAGYDRMMKLWDIRMRHAIATGSTGTSNLAGTVPGSAAASSLVGSGTGGAGGSATAGSAAAGLIKLYEERSLGGYLLKRCASAAISEVVVGGWDNSLVISASADGEIRLWDLKYDLHNPCTTINAHRDRITSILWNNQEEFYTSSFDGSVRAWDSIHARSTHCLQVFAPNTEGITQLHMTDFYHKIAATLPLAPATAALPSSTSASSGIAMAGVAAPQQQMTLHRQCMVVSGWAGSLKVYAHDHFVQSTSKS